MQSSYSTRGGVNRATTLENRTVGTGEEPLQLPLVLTTIGLCAIAGIGIVFAMVVHPVCVSVSASCLVLAGYLWYHNRKQPKTMKQLNVVAEPSRRTSYAKRYGVTRAISLTDREEDAVPVLLTEEDMFLLCAKSKFYSSM